MSCYLAQGNWFITGPSSRVGRCRLREHHRGPDPRWRCRRCALAACGDAASARFIGISRIALRHARGDFARMNGVKAPLMCLTSGLSQDPAYQSVLARSGSRGCNQLQTVRRALGAPRAVASRAVATTGVATQRAASPGAASRAMAGPAATNRRRRHSDWPGDRCRRSRGCRSRCAAPDSSQIAAASEISATSSPFRREGGGSSSARPGPTGRPAGGRPARASSPR